MCVCVCVHESLCPLRCVCVHVLCVCVDHSDFAYHSVNFYEEKRRHVVECSVLHIRNDFLHND